MFEKMMSFLKNVEDCINEGINRACWYGFEPSSDEIGNLMMVENMILMWEHQHEEFLKREAQADAEDNYYLQLESRLAGVRTRY